MIHSASLSVILLSFILSFSGCTRPEVSPLIADFPEKEYRSTYSCPDGSIFNVESDGNQARLSFAERHWILQRTVSSAGEKYQQERNLYWSRGHSALFEVDDKLFLNCTASQFSQPRQQAFQSGILIRAVGQEPGWIVEVLPASTLLVTDYGQNRQEFPESVVTQATDGKSISYQINDHPQRIELLVTKTACQDSMSGEHFPAQAALIINDQNFNGCADIFP